MRIVKTKNCRRDRTYHRIQLFIYKILVSKLLDEKPISIDGEILTTYDLECVVARIDESTNKGQNQMKLFQKLLKIYSIVLKCWFEIVRRFVGTPCLQGLAQ